MRNQLAAGIPPHWWDRLKGAQIGFVGGLMIGLLMGWFFHGIISIAVRMGVLLILLLPLIVIAWFWLRSQRATRSSTPSGPAVITWSSRTVAEPEGPQHRSAPDAFIDVPVVTRAEESRPTDIEAELEALRRRREPRI
jgi:predicted lipid-binding transport protein (Tim44 family)